MLNMLARAAALALTLVAGAAGAAAAEPALVKVETGLLAGEAKDGVGVWRAIPYAAPPVGERRWAPPPGPAPGRASATPPGTAPPASRR